MKPLIHVGASERTIESVVKALMTLINSHSADDVKLAAIEALIKISSVNNTTIAHCTINGGK